MKLGLISCNVFSVSGYRVLLKSTVHKRIITWNPFTWSTGCFRNLIAWIHVYMYDWIPSLFIWNYQNIVNWLYPNTKLKLLKKNDLGAHITRRKSWAHNTFWDRYLEFKRLRDSLGILASPRVVSKSAASPPGSLSDVPNPPTPCALNQKQPGQGPRVICTTLYLEKHWSAQTIHRVVKDHP